MCPMLCRCPLTTRFSPMGPVRFARQLWRECLHFIALAYVSILLFLGYHLLGTMAVLRLILCLTVDFLFYVLML